MEGEVVAQKVLMVQPNMPRFVRVGDEAVITTRIINTGEHTLKGDASLRLEDAETVGPVALLVAALRGRSRKDHIAGFPHSLGCAETLAC